MVETKKATIVIADDDDDDFLIIKEAYEEADLTSNIVRVSDGEDLMNYLLCRDKYKNQTLQHPILILLDLNMPKKDGREVLKEIRLHKELYKIPIIVLTTSNLEKDINESYSLGVHSFIRKPVNYSDFVEVFRTFKKYWLEIVQLPS